MLWPVSFGENWYSKMYAGHSLKGKIENHPFYRVVFCVLAGKRTGKPPFRQAGGAAGDQCFRCSLRSQRARRRRSRTMKPPLHSTMKAAAMKTPR